MSQPEFVYYAFDHKNRCVQTSRWWSIFDARKGTRALLKRAKRFGLVAWVTYHRVEPNRGVFVVDITFSVEHGSDEITRVFHPPALIGG